MKREGRQHGVVRSYRVLPSPLNLRPNTRYVNKFDSPPTAGLFIKVPAKPTNHSKFTGKCGIPHCTSCHMHPAHKSKDKAKGTQKLKSSEAVLNYRLVSWRVVDSTPGLNFSQFSASRILDHLSKDYINDYDYDYDHDQEDRDGEDCKMNGVSHEGEVEGTLAFDGNDGVNNQMGMIKNNDSNDDENGIGVVIDDECYGDVEDFEDEGWCLVK